MIFVTVGTQLPFDRLVRAVDDWAGAVGGREVFAQIGPTSYRPRHIAYSDFVAPEECRRYLQEADAIVAHAGMGTILNALQLGKPVLVLPRLAALGEHRNEHQLATASRLRSMGLVTVADDVDDLVEKLDRLDALTADGDIGAYAPEPLIGALRSFIAA